MSEIVKTATVILCFLLCILGGIWAWWAENGSSKNPKNNSQENKKTNGETKE